MTEKFGCIYIPEHSEEVEMSLAKGAFGDAAGHLVGSGAGKKRFLFEDFKKIGMKFPVLHQLSAPTCVAFAVAGAVNNLKATEIALGDNEEYLNHTAQSDLYYGSRVIIGRNRLRGRGGSQVSWCVKYIAEYGTLMMQKYPGGIDLTKYDPRRAVRWGNNSGAPKGLKALAEKNGNVILAYSRVKSWEEYRDSIYNDCPVIIGSRYGYSNSTDKEGFCKQNTTWNHGMYHCGMWDDARRPGGVCSNSWGPSWLRQNGNPIGMPRGTFRIDADNIDKMCRNGDAWSISAFEGYKIEREPVDTGVMW
jgi:hypothetical protein